MRLPPNHPCFLNKSNFNNLVNNLLSRSEIRLCDLLRLFLLVLPQEWHGEGNDK